MPASSPRGTNEGNETHDPRTSAMWKLLVNAPHVSVVQHGLEKFERETRTALGDAAYLEAEDALRRIFEPTHEMTRDEDKEAHRVLDAAYAAVDRAAATTRDTSTDDVAAMLS